MIEKGIPIPQISHYGAMKLVAAEMEVMDSYLCATDTQSGSLISALRRAGRKASVRKCREGWRVWRIA